MMNYVLPVAVLLVIVVLAFLTGGAVLVPAFPVVVLMLQKLGVMPQ